MPTYIMLAHYTDQGVRTIKDAPKRAAAFRQLCEKVGARVKDAYRTMGRYDLALVVEAPDNATMNGLLYSVGALGNIRTETLLAFTEQEVNQALAKMG
jgi:uncharacterized protein with GYD domain